MKKRHKASKQKTAKAKAAKRPPAKAKRLDRLAKEMATRLRSPLPSATAKRHKPVPLKHSPVAILAADWHQTGAPLRELMQETLPLGKIKIGPRHRKDFGDLAALARDINARGLLQPIVVDRDNKLIAGERRLRAWELSIFRSEPIPVRFVPLKDIVAGEWAENDPSLRKDFTPSEGVAIKQAIEAALKPAALERQRAGVKAAAAGEVAEKAAQFTGKSRRTLDKAEEIVRAAEAEPEKYGALKDAMDKSGRVDGPHKRLKNLQAADAIRAAPPPLPDNGPYRGVVVDFPWAAEPEDDDPERLARGYYPYPTMAIGECAEFARVHIKPRLHADAWVALWITNFHLAKGHQVKIAEALGANAVTILTGVKTMIGRGQVARGTTEHAVLLRIGKPPIETFPRTDFAFAVDRNNHSRKPQSFYEAFARAVAAPRYASFFETTPRGDKWDCHGNKMAAAGSPAACPSENLLEAAGPAADFSEDELRRQLLLLETVQRAAALPRVFADMRALFESRKWIAGKRKLTLTDAGQVRLGVLRMRFERAPVHDPALPPSPQIGAGAPCQIDLEDYLATALPPAIAAMAPEAVRAALAAEFSAGVAGHVVTNTIDWTAGAPGVSVKTCQCGLVVRAPRDVSGDDVLDRHLLAHWRDAGDGIPAFLQRKMPEAAE